MKTLVKHCVHEHTISSHNQADPVYNSVHEYACCRAKHFQYTNLINIVKHVLFHKSNCITWELNCTRFLK